MIENIFYFLRLCNSTYNKQTYIWVFNLYNMIYHSCCMLIFFFFFAQLVVTLPHFFFKKCCQYNTYCFQYIKLIFDFCWKKEAFYVCRLCFQGFHEKKIMLWILKMLKTKTKSSKIKFRFGILRANFLGCALYHALAASCAWKIEPCRDVLWKLNIYMKNFFCFLAEECMKKQKYSVKEITYFLHIVMHAKVK